MPTDTVLTVLCVRCGWEEEGLALIMRKDDSEPDPTKRCPTCKKDGWLAVHASRRRNRRKA